MANKECRWCHKKFIILKKEKVYCSNKCRKVSKLSSKRYHINHKKQELQYRNKHKKERIKYIQNYNKINRLKIKLALKKYYQIHKKERLQYLKIHQIKLKKYRQSRRKEIAKYMKNKWQTDLSFKLASILRHRIYMTLKDTCKSASTIKLIGCSIEYLKQHLEKQFKLRMTWKNYGKWHVDHIKPCCKFNLSKKREQRKCFNYRNLQPLWAKENWSKSGK